MEELVTVLGVENATQRDQLSFGKLLARLGQSGAKDFPEGFVFAVMPA